MSTVQNALIWLHAHVSALFAIIGDVSANRPAPAGQVVVYTLVAAVLLVAVLKAAAKKVKS